MDIWLVRDLDPLPIDGKTRRLMRSALLADMLVERGHQVTWFTSDFDHYLKTHRPFSGQIAGHDGLRFEIVPGHGYSKNISLARIAHNRRFARDFLKRAGELPRPDVVLVDLPTTEAAEAAVRFARTLGIPSILSVRDLWPDFFADFLPIALRPLAAPGLKVLERQARFACAHTTALIGISTAYLRWGQAKAAHRDTRYDAVFPLGYAHRASSQEERDRVQGRLGLPSSKYLVTFVGNWGLTNDLDLVADAAALLAGSRPDVHFAIAGNPTSRPTLEGRFEALSNVTLTGWIDAGTIEALLEATQIGLLPYTGRAPQGLPNKVFEYMAHGCFQLATLGGETQTLLHEEKLGLAVPGMDGTAMARHIEALVDNPAVLNDRERRRAVFTARFDARTVYTRFSEHIELVAHAARG